MMRDTKLVLEGGKKEQKFPKKREKPQWENPAGESRLILNQTLSTQLKPINLFALPLAVKNHQELLQS